MADNYLERRYEEYRNGKNIVRKVNPSLDSLLSDTGAPQVPTDMSYKVKAAQLEAIVNSARRTGIPFEYTISEDDATVTASCEDSIGLGQILLALRLKAAELKLRTEASAEGDRLTVRVFK